MPLQPLAKPDNSDETLVERFVRGNNDSFSVLIDRYFNTIYNIAGYMLSSHAGHVEDITQEIFLEAYKSVKSFGFRSTFKTWLFSLARNVILYRRRSLSNSHTVSLDKVTEDENDWLAIPDALPLPQEFFEKSELELKVKEALEKLPDKLRITAILRYYEDLSYDEIAGLLDIPVGTVRSRIHNATVLLATELRGYVKNENQ